MPNWRHGFARLCREHPAQLVVAAEAGGDDGRALAQRLLAPLDAAIRLALQDALAAAAEEITCELAPGSVELRLRGGELEFAVTSPPVDGSGDRPDDDGDDLPRPGRRAGFAEPVDGDDGGMSRINLRMPENLKARVEQAAASEGLSVNAWLVRAATAALERVDSGPSSASKRPRRAISATPDGRADAVARPPDREGRRCTGSILRIPSP